MRLRISGWAKAETYAAESETLSGGRRAGGYLCSSRKTDLGQLKTVILGKGLLQDSARLDALLGELERSQAVSEKVMLLAADSAAACVEKAMKEDSKTGLFLWDFYKNTAEEVAVTKGIDFGYCFHLTERTGRAAMACFRGFAPRGKGCGLAVARPAVSTRGASILNEEEERGYLFLLGDAEGAVLEGKYEASVLPLAVTKTKADYDFQAAGDTVLCTVTLPVEGTLQGGRAVLSAEQKRVGEYFPASIKEEVEHTIKQRTVRRVRFPRYSAKGRARPAAACKSLHTGAALGADGVSRCPKGADYGYGAQALIKI